MGDRYLVLYFLEQPGPNLAHMLLGFPARQLSREIARIDLLREPSRQSCLRTMYFYKYFLPISTRKLSKLFFTPF
jgi:hypothetical protein